MVIACRARQVTLFKRNYHHVVPDSYFKSYHQVSRGNPNYFITYGNGKSAARMHQGVRPNGAHRWYSYVKAPRCPPCCRKPHTAVWTVALAPCQSTFWQDGVLPERRRAL